MNFNFKSFIYHILIDPLLSGPRNEVVEKAKGALGVIDIACGTGSLAIAISAVAGDVTGIDLDEELISYASKRIEKKGIRNTRFEVRDASDLLVYGDRQFDIAVTSMAIHQFEEELALRILKEMKRIAMKVIIADYNYPMPHGFSRMVAYGIERMAKGDHTRNFMNYMSRGGIKWFTDTAGVKVKSETVRGNGVFIVIECE